MRWLWLVSLFFVADVYASRKPEPVDVQVETTVQGGDVVNTYRNRKHAASAIAPDMSPSGPCAYGAAGAAQGPTIGISFGRAKIDPACVRREIVRMMFAMGMVEQANRGICAESVAAGIHETIEDCLPLGNEYITVSEHEDALVAAAKSYESQVSELNAKVKALSARVAKSESRAKQAAVSTAAKSVKPLADENELRRAKARSTLAKLEGLK